MRRQSHICIAFLAFLLLISCLGESGQKIEALAQPGVYIITDTIPAERIVLKNREQIYSSQIANLNAEDGDCYFINSFILDYDAAVNADSGSVNGYYTVENVNAVALPKGEIIELADTGAIIDNEVFISGITNRSHLILENYFLYITFNSRDSILKEPVDYRLSYDLEQRDTLATGEIVYKMVLRTYRNSRASHPLAYETIDVKPFDIYEFIESVAIRDKFEGDSICFRINYPTSYNNDTTKIDKWGQSRMGVFYFTR